MVLNSPLIPTITSNPEQEGNVLNLKYTLPSGVIVYAPQAPVKVTRSEDIKLPAGNLQNNNTAMQVGTYLKPFLLNTETTIMLYM